MHTDISAVTKVMYTHRKIKPSPETLLVRNDDMYLPHFSNTTLDHILAVTTVARDLKGDISYQHRVACDSLKGITKKVIPCPI